jgi:predicted nucleic acid-binding protein
MALAWLMERDDPQEAQLAQRAVASVVSQGALVPALFFPEVTNGLLTAERRKVATRLQASRLQADLEALPIESDALAPESTQTAVFALAMQTGLTAYDATYLELALRSHAQLATFDRDLAQAARTAGVKVFGD